MEGLLSTGPTPSSFHIMKLLKHFVPHVPRRKVWLNAQFMGRIEGSQTPVLEDIGPYKIIFRLRAFASPVIFISLNTCVFG